jgi:threonine dehydrogenase-like Zn-dependent dehydrogenase
MRALTVRPLEAGSLQLSDVPEPIPGPDELLVDGLALGICGTDRELISGAYGFAPAGADRMILGHESLGRVRAAPPGADFAPGDLVVGVVRRPDPRPCGACAHGEFDMCRNGEYTERGIKQRDGYGSERWTVETGYAVKLDPKLAEAGVLMEPTSVVAKAWEEVERIGARAWFEPQTVLVTGAGPIGLLAALLGVQRGLEVHVLDRVTEGAKPEAVAALGAHYHSDPVDKVAGALTPDVVIEATGASHLVWSAMSMTAAYGITCLAGVSSRGHTLDVDLGETNRSIVLENDVVVGSVNANLRHYAAAAEALAQADPGWLRRLISRRVPLADYRAAFTPQPDDIKVVLSLS